jgi:uncharacterized repeat protein (TIGR01451 family)
MNRQGWIHLALLAGAVAAGPGAARGQGPPGPLPAAAPIAMPPSMEGPASAGDAAVAGPEAGAPMLPPDVQVVRFNGPDGAKLDVLGPATEPVPVGDGQGLATVGLHVGVGYRLRLSNLPNRPGVHLFPVVEIVGHLHRPEGIDPGKFPIRINFTDIDLDDAIDRGRLVTQVVYLEDPELALPMNLPKGETPSATLSPAEEPLRVGAALGRVMAIVRIGGRLPMDEELMGAPGLGPGVGACPFVGPDGGRCPLPCGPVRGTPPPLGRRWLPKDEFLCDGGDHGTPVHFGGDGGLRGIDPRDAILRFRDDRRPRVLPTNMVCIYAPRFAVVRTSIGANQNLTVQVPAGAEMLQHEATRASLAVPRRMTLNQSPELNRHRARPSALINRLAASTHFEVRILGSANQVTHVAGHILTQGPESARKPEKPVQFRERVKPVAIKTAESAVVTGIVQGAGEQVMAWKPQEIAGVELPPGRPGVAVVKRVSADQAEPGDVVTFVIQYRNMGNTPIGSVSVIDSLLPRLEYVAGSAKGPAGTVFTAGENAAGSTELRWDLPGVLAPGAEGSVSFDTKVR